MGFVLSLAASLGQAFVLERFDNTIKSISDVSRYVQLPTLGVIPAIEAGGSPNLLAGMKKKKRKLLDDGSNGKRADSDSAPILLPTGTGTASETGRYSGTRIGGLDGWSSIAEAYRSLRTSVLLSTAGNPPKTILFTSGCPAEGKTTTVINTAISLAQLGASVLIVDADLRKPALQKGFNIKRGPGLSTYLSRHVDIEPMIQRVQIPNLSLLPCGPIPPNPAELIGSERMKEMLRALGTQYDHILIDSPPLMYVTDPVILSTLVDGVIIVVHGGKSSRDVVRQSRQMLANVGAKIFGVVLNNVNHSHKSYGDSYYGSYSEDEFDGRERISDMFG
jgi:capsular exopolysaccharide synthesis family protein